MRNLGSSNSMSHLLTTSRIGQLWPPPPSSWPKGLEPRSGNCSWGYVKGRIQIFCIYWGRHWLHTWPRNVNQPKSHQPVQKKYTSVPRPLYPEVKPYIEDLLNYNFITESRSPHSSPVVCVRKKDWTLRLCVDYRELNFKTIADRHPIRRVQDWIRLFG